MSWLRDHFHNFVFPAFLAAEKKTTEIGPPVHIEPSQHAPAKLPTELRKLWTLCKEHNVEWSYDIRSINAHGGHSKYRDSARVHHRILRSTLESSEAAMRTEGCDRLLLPGRDIWVLAVMAARRRVPFLFLPELSRVVSDSPGARPYLLSAGFTGRELVVDTGYVGSVPKNIGKLFPEASIKFRLMSQTDVVPQPRPGEAPRLSKFERRPNQLFPNRVNARNEALESEYLSKYWKCGTIQKNVVDEPAFKVLAEWGRKPSVTRFMCDAFPHIVAGPNGDLEALNNDLYYCVYDGSKVARVTRASGHSLPAFKAWWESLPQHCVESGHPADYFEGTDPTDLPVSVREEVVQYFATKRDIQRAALLTSMVFRGIPYWKLTGKPKHAEVGVYNTNGGIMMAAPGGVATTNVNFSTNFTTTNTFTIGAGMQQAQVHVFPNLLAHPMQGTAGTTPIALANAAGTTAGIT